MILGKRPRPSMRRTTSMTEFTVDLPPINPSQPSDFQAPKKNPEGFDPRILSMVSPRNPRRNSGELIQTAHFLRACGLCKRRLAPGRDIYMYRGDTAFCSLECRQQQMNQDERKEKCSSASMKNEAPPTTKSEASSNGETMAAA
ncbi:FCS-Like Zinc finger 6-like [Tasmannia lanceolata]|uniref:FCS-Like Zinc finger 6-like n=1 Tax=Tasmannia lanceolata TaxID=3420 RepID=UPI00406337B5